jgi:DNA-nicking Smr family endonuclease
MTRRRKLRPEEEDLWRIVARTARPLHPHPLKGKPAEVEPEPLLVPKDRPSPPDLPRLPAFRLGEMARPAAGAEPVETMPALRMDAKAFGKMTRGKLLPEARIDLHGMKLAQAHPELIRFILGSHSAGLRLVLVITGKGKPKPDHGPIPQRTGVLRHQVPQWLRLPPLGPALVLQVAEAHQRHGGAGAYYVYLRRSR